MPTSFRCWLTVGVLVVLTVAGTGIVTSGDTINVPDDYNTLREALQEADAGDVIEISRSTLRESISVRSVRGVTVRSENKSRPVTIIGRYDTKPVLDLTNCRDLVFENVEIQSGSVGVQITNSQEVTFVKCIVQLNNGAGFYANDLSDDLVNSINEFTLEECTVRDNLGWGIERIGDPTKIQDSRVNLVKSTITNNALGGLHIQSAVATVASALFTRNIGYGLFVDGLASVTFNDQATPTQVSENTLGGILVKDSTLTLRGSALVQSNLGAGVRAENAQLTLDGATISGHTQPAVLYVSSQGSVLNGFIQDNADVGLRLDAQSAVTVSRTTVARQGGNGIEVLNGSTATVNDASILTENKASGLLANATAVTVADATASKNTVAGIRLVQGATGAVQNAAVVENVRDGIQVDASTLTLTGGTVSRNGQHGVLVTSAGMATVGTAAVVSQNAVDGVHVDQSTSVVQNAQVSANRRDGVNVVTGTGVTPPASSATLQGATVSDNVRNGVYAGPATTVTIEQASKVQKNGANGLLLETASGTIDSSEFRENGQNGASATQSSTLTIRNGSLFAANAMNGVYASTSFLDMSASTRDVHARRPGAERPANGQELGRRDNARHRSQPSPGRL